MSHPQDNQERARLQHDAEHAKPRKKGAVLIYLVVLFAAAFLLLLLSYFMQQRTNQDALAGLTETSTSAVQSLDNLIKERDALKAEAIVQETRLAALEQEVAAAKSAATEGTKALQDAVSAMDYLRRIQQFYTAKSYNSARAVIEKFVASGLVSALPTESTYQNESNTVLSPAAEYQRIYDALY